MIHWLVLNTSTSDAAVRGRGSCSAKTIQVSLGVPSIGVMREVLSSGLQSVHSRRFQGAFQGSSGLVNQARLSRAGFCPSICPASQLAPVLQMHLNCSCELNSIVRLK